jgi:hypothetical protein
VALHVLRPVIGLWPRNPGNLLAQEGKPRIDGTQGFDGLAFILGDPAGQVCHPGAVFAADWVCFSMWAAGFLALSGCQFGELLGDKL